LRFETLMKANSEYISSVWAKHSVFRGNPDREGKKRVLVVWGDMTGLDPIKDREFLEATAKEIGPFEEQWVNGDSAAKGFASLDPLFKRLMTGGET